MYKKRFVCPVPSWLRGKLLDFNRLYAYPTKPESIKGADFLILDSGAYGLSLSKKKMDDLYLYNLNEHYSKYKTKHVYCVAPDTFLNYKETISKFEKWHDKKYTNVQPVVQMAKAKDFTWGVVKYQLDYYSEFFGGNIDFLLFSNPFCRKVEYPVGFFKKIHDLYAIDWIHNLGAGWSVNDVVDWSSSDINSIDTLAYYNAVNSVDGNWSRVDGSRVHKAINNAKIANKIMNI